MYLARAFNYSIQLIFRNTKPYVQSFWKGKVTKVWTHFSTKTCNVCNLKLLKSTKYKFHVIKACKLNSKSSRSSYLCKSRCKTGLANNQCQNIGCLIQSIGRLYISRWSRRGFANRKLVFDIRCDSQDRIPRKEIHRLEVEPRRYGRHDWVIFLARNMMESQCVPQHDVLVLNGPIPA